MAINVAETAEITVRGTVVKVVFQSPSFTAGRLLLRSPGDWPDGRAGDFISFAGSAFVAVDQTVSLRGTVEQHTKYGRQLKVTGLVYELPVDADGLADWLARHPDAKGIGPIRARKIAAAFGSEFSTVLRSDPERIAQVAGVPLESAYILQRSWIAEEEFNSVATRLVAWGLTDGQTRAVLKQYGASAPDIIEQDPYLLLGEISGFGFRRVDDIAMARGVAKDHPGRIRAGVVYTLGEFLENGSTCPDLDRLAEAAGKHLALDNLDATEKVYEAVAALVAADTIQGERLGEERRVALTSVHHQESALFAWLQRGGAAVNPHFHQDRITLVIDTYCDKRLDGSQLKAVYTALQKRFSLISGGAGAGKTWTVRAITQAYRAAGKSIELCAPTGKAARRLVELVGIEARTIHRLLDYHPAVGFRVNSNNPLGVDVVICDEFSMVDIHLLWALAQALTDRTDVVFVGDHHQLPPVGPGAVLRDAIRHRLVPTTLLQHCHRQAGVLKQNCSAVLEGIVAPTAEWTGDGPGPWYVRDGLATADDVLSVLRTLFTEIVPAWGLDRLSDVQVMTPIHKGPLGVVALNAMLQRLHQESLGVVVDAEKPTLYVGDKCIQTKNNYALDIMNGHQGIVLQTEPLVVEFEGRSVAIPKECYGQVQLAYALTVHKLQGSEVPLAITIAHKMHSFMLHRGWLYTAVTRARRSDVLLTDGWGLKAAARRQEDDLRQTVLDVLGWRARAERVKAAVFGAG
jgi:exodeoxyribonuclease V alpha subunit